MTSGTIPLAVLVLGVLSSVPVEGPARPSRPIWQWSAEERIAMRTDPLAARERAGRGGRRITSNVSETAANPVADAFDGRTHPELFLPHEVFTHVMRIGFMSPPETREAFRAAVQADAQRVGLPADFWQEFEAVSAMHVGDLVRFTELARAPLRVQEDVDHAQTQACRSGADALQAARQEFGEEPFNRFLYEVIARSMFYVADQLQDASRMRAEAGGCR